MTINEIINEHQDVAVVEVYASIGKGPYFPDHIHESNCNPVYSYSKDREREHILYRVMNARTYEETMLADSCIEADFAEWFGNRDAKVLVILIEED